MAKLPTWQNINGPDVSYAGFASAMGAFGKAREGFGQFSDFMSNMFDLETSQMNNVAATNALNGKPYSNNPRVDQFKIDELMRARQTHEENVQTADVTQRGLTAEAIEREYGNSPEVREQARKNLEAEIAARNSTVNANNASAAESNARVAQLTQAQKVADALSKGSQDATADFNLLVDQDVSSRVEQYTPAINARREEALAELEKSNLSPAEKMAQSVLINTEYDREIDQSRISAREEAQEALLLRFPEIAMKSAQDAGTDFNQIMANTYYGQTNTALRNEALKRAQIQEESQNAAFTFKSDMAEEAAKGSNLSGIKMTPNGPEYLETEEDVKGNTILKGNLDAYLRSEGIELENPDELWVITQGNKSVIDSIINDPNLVERDAWFGPNFDESSLKAKAQAARLTLMAAGADFKNTVPKPSTRLTYAEGLVRKAGDSANAAFLNTGEAPVEEGIPTDTKENRVTALSDRLIKARDSYAEVEQLDVSSYALKNLLEELKVSLDVAMSPNNSTVIYRPQAAMGGIPQKPLVQYTPKDAEARAADVAKFEKLLKEFKDRKKAEEKSAELRKSTEEENSAIQALVNQTTGGR